MAYFFQNIPDAAARLIVVFLLFVLGVFLVAGRIPDAYKDGKSQIAAATRVELSKILKYAGEPACVECHDAEYNTKKTGYHRNLSCETCHGPARAHAEDPGENTPLLPRERQFCAKCHT